MSSPRKTANTRPRERNFQGRVRSLQVRLALMISVVLLLVTAVIGSVSIAVQNQNLMRRVDEQLRISLEMATGMSRDLSIGLWPQTDPSQMEPEQRPVGPRFGSLNMTIRGSHLVVAEVVDAQGDTVTLDKAQIDQLLQSVITTPGPTDVDLSGLGPYRIIGVSTIDTDEPVMVVVGQSLAEVERTTRGLIGTFTLAGLVGVLIASLASIWMVRKSLAPLEELRLTASRISETPLSTGSGSLTTRVDSDNFTPGTEVGDLAESFNQMLDHVEDALVHRAQSEAKLKQFAADASHELRTPLSNVSGYAEFAARQNDTLPPDVAQSLSRIQSESKRMSGIVEKLLLLARMDSADFETGETTDAVTAVLDSVNDARVTSPDHTWKVVIGEDATEARVPLSADLLRQVVGNLTTNARIHTPAGTTVIVSLTVSSDGFAAIRVEDDGPGIPEDLAPRVFDRFVRADAARTGTADPNVRSTGLGLSITESIVRGAGGSVALDSVPGRTVFSVYLPLAH